MLERIVAPRTKEYNITRLWARPPARDGETQQHNIVHERFVAQGIVSNRTWRLAMFPFSSLWWHDICNTVTRGEHMSYKGTISANRRQFERQQEKLRIAREALARVEAKYARKLPVKHPTEPLAKRGAQWLRGER
jgi:hypothetical protein